MSMADGCACAKTYDEWTYDEGAYDDENENK